MNFFQDLLHLIIPPNSSYPDPPDLFSLPSLYTFIVAVFMEKKRLLFLEKMRDNKYVGAIL